LQADAPSSEPDVSSLAELKKLHEHTMPEIDSNLVHTHKMNTDAGSISEPAASVCAPPTVIDPNPLPPTGQPGDNSSAELPSIQLTTDNSSAEIPLCALQVVDLMPSATSSDSLHAVNNNRNSRCSSCLELLHEIGKLKEQGKILGEQLLQLCEERDGMKANLDASIANEVHLRNQLYQLQVHATHTLK
jgi:hypothetical protein